MYTTQLEQEEQNDKHINLLSKWQITFQQITTSDMRANERNCFKLNFSAICFVFRIQVYIHILCSIIDLRRIIFLYMKCSFEASNKGGQKSYMVRWLKGSFISFLSHNHPHPHRIRIYWLPFILYFSV